MFPRLDHKDVLFLKKEVKVDETNFALFDMASLKWDVVSDAVCEWVQKVFVGHNIDPELNSTLLVFIPKTSNPESLVYFRPISLCTVLYKLVMKARLIVERNITNNAIITQEVIHSMRSKQKNLKWIAIKIELKKA
ncbi:Retrovirus-related Pol polyprotein LINE-1 [Gossypium australe]|uniref:Retrovirus-related Pol polyprotein LINE-1 n=1 Tax=Gossypium australe TaxID=47621 RepID=A0A5B6VIU7_9ROSI|nr:Retrovirus-related Pol polyprotein LINE-1 [Gossypium australe]